MNIPKDVLLTLVGHTSELVDSSWVQEFDRYQSKWLIVYLLLCRMDAVELQDFNLELLEMSLSSSGNQDSSESNKTATNNAQQTETINTSSAQLLSYPVVPSPKDFVDDQLNSM